MNLDRPPTPSDDRTGPRILVVDDNPSIHRDFDLVLQEHARDVELEADERQMYGQSAPAVLKPPYRLDHALSGIEGVEKVQAAVAEDRPYQLAFVDIRMPGIDGVETIEQIWRADPRVQVVICTAFADYSWEDLLGRWGQTDKLLVLKKPFDSIEVVLLASTLTEKWFLGRQAALKQEEMELLVARRTQKLLELQPLNRPEETATTVSADGPAAGADVPLILLLTTDAALGPQLNQRLSGRFRVLDARSSEDGLRQAQETVPDLVITELAAPKLDGLNVCRSLKRAELTSHIPVVVLAGDGRDDAHRRAVEAGADLCLARPLNLALLETRVTDLLRARGAAPAPPAAPPLLPPRQLAASHADAQFLRRTLEHVDRHLSDFEFDVEALARQMAVSRRQLFRKLKAVTGGTPHGLIRAMRLKRAAQLLQESQLTVTEITYAVGFSDLKHFRSVFREQFGVLPAEYSRQSPASRPPA